MQMPMGVRALDRDYVRQRLTLQFMRAIRVVLLAC
jgi:hypothetical protein